MTRESAVAEARALFNRICIVHDSDLVRVVGFHEDGMDYYYRVRSRERDLPAHRKGRPEWLATYVGACVTLEGIERYDRLEAGFTRDGCPPAEAFIDTTASRAEDRRDYGAMAVDLHHPDVDRVELSDRSVDDPVWFTILREDERRIVSIEEHDGMVMTQVPVPFDGDWTHALLERVAARGGTPLDACRAMERTRADESEALRDYPDIMEARIARRRDEKDATASTRPDTEERP